MRFLMLCLASVAAVPLAAQTDLTCPFRGSAERLARRASPLDSLAVALDGDQEQFIVCYGRPSARGRTMIGGEAVPFDAVWRTGANETTKIRSTVPLVIAGMAVPAGTYALYTVPGEREWQVVVNRSWEQWGEESGYTPDVAAQEVGRATVPVEPLDQHIETFTIRAEPSGARSVNLILEWEHTRIRVPIALGT